MPNARGNEVPHFLLAERHCQVKLKVKTKCVSSESKQKIFNKGTVKHIICYANQRVSHARSQYLDEVFSVDKVDLA